MIKKILLFVFTVIISASIGGVAGIYIYKAKLNSFSDIQSEIYQYEWTDLYHHKNDYTKTCEYIYWLLPSRLNIGDYSDSLDSGKPWDFAEMDSNFIQNYGGVYQNGIPMKNRTYEECYAKTIEVLKTLHKEYIEKGIIKKVSIQ